ncbi:unnamed protein product [Dimorphilus gyrociliatus]|uniref:AMP-dependent synthetase/ligase domain-containing protein n=1 Tax=Dimorphilus gyrociliatus TaxID=2664684 RepID=A0A7I8W9T6_9ANNE|nr:unnamed protein product [Dimorphilus gyrociliatus]
MNELSYCCKNHPNEYEVKYNTVDYFLDRYDEEEGNKECMIFYDSCMRRSSLTRSQWSNQSLQFAYNLFGKGKKGDVYCLLLPNRPEFAISFIGLQRLGFNTLLTPRTEFLRLLLNDFKFKGLVTLSSYWKRFSDNKKAQDLSHIILIEDEKLDNVTDNVILYKDLIKECSMKPKLPRVQNDEDLIILTTSGSVGKPKLVQVHQKKYLGNINKALMNSIAGDNVIFSDRPLAYSGGLTLIFGFLSGLQVVMTDYPCSNQGSFTTKDIATIISKENCSRVVLFAYLICDMVNSPNDFRLIAKHAKVILTGGQAICMSTIHHIWEIAPSLPVVEVYASTEMGRAFLKTRTKEDPNPFPVLPAGTEFSIRDENGDILERGEIGEIWVRNKTMMICYFNDPENTSKTLNKNGWIKTGDLALMTDDGNIKFQGRLNDVIKIATLKTYPLPFENVMNNNKCIEICVVLGLPDERLGCHLCLVVKLKKEWIHKETEAHKEIEDYWNENFKSDVEGGVVHTLKKIFFITEWPLTSSTKILRRKLYDMFKI